MELLDREGLAEAEAKQATGKAQVRGRADASLQPGLAGAWVAITVFLLVWLGGGDSALNLLTAGVSAVGAALVWHNFQRAEGRPEVTNWVSVVVWLVPATSLLALVVLICRA